MRRIKMMPVLSVIFSFFLLQNINAQQTDVKTIKSKLNDATVYLRGAELTHSATATLNKGDNEIRIEGLSPNIDRNSLRIKSSNGVVISSFEFSTDELPLNKPNETRMQIMRDSVNLLTEQLDKVKAEIKIDSELTQLMKKGTDRNIADTIGVNDLMKVMEYYQSKSTEIEMRQIANRKKQAKLEIAMAELNVRLRSESAKKDETSGVLRLTTSAPLATTCSFTISYYTAAARWVPYYDINIKQTDKPIEIVAKARVSQTTTVNWDKVRLTLSTTTPSSGKIAPLFNAWFLQYQQPAIQARGAGSLPMQNSYSFNQSYIAETKDEKSLNEVVVMGYGTQKKETPSASNTPLYVVNGEIVDESYYRSLDPASIKDVSVLKDAASTALYGARGSAGVVLITLKNDVSDYITENENELNLTFNIDLPYTIPGDGKEQSIVMQIKSATAEYKYYCAPKLDNETYLLAEVPEWEKLNLLSGKANITYDETYVGETYINAGSTQEKLSLTLGADKRVSVKRELLKDYSTKKTFGSDIKQVFVYKITVKNNQNKPIRMVLKDQYPKSKNKELEAELLIKDCTPPTKNNEDVGVLNWEDDFKAGETKTYQISYSIKYPKDKEGLINF